MNATISPKVQVLKHPNSIFERFASIKPKSEMALAGFAIAQLPPSLCRVRIHVIVKRCRSKQGDFFSMKIATYNLRAGGTSRDHWQKLIEEEGVDLLLVQESSSPEKHLPELLYPSLHKQIVWEMVPGRRWGSGIFSRHGRVERISLAEFHGWVTGALISEVTWPDSSTDNLLVFSLHAPSVQESYAMQVNRILDRIKSMSTGMPVLIGGDFNLTVSRSNDPKKPTSKVDLNIQSRLETDFGLKNCWQTANPDCSLGQTLRWSRDTTIAYHCDGLFAPYAWSQFPFQCHILAGDAWSSMSDHNPVVAEWA
jgi:endonuclease/exonuclease/phosphatase family metal-dependent hydrolase